MDLIAGILILVCRLLGFAIIARAILSWFSLRPDNQIRRFLDDLTEPFLSPLRRIIPQTSGIDFTPMVAILILFYVIPLLLTLLIEAI